MTNLPLFLVVVVLGIAMFASAQDGLYIDIDEMSATKGSVVGEGSSSDGDDDDGSSMLSDQGSGESGSGESTTDSQTTQAESTTAETTDKTIPGVTTEMPDGDGKTTSTKSPDESTTTVASEITSTQEQDTSTKEVTVDPNDGMNAMARSNPEEKVLRVLTTEVIAAVVVGAVCAVILIAFLVYRLRKRDEGSYPLSDSSYKDTYKLRGDTGKEAFV